MKSKFQEIAEVIRRKVSHGDYTNTPLPGERKLADELQVSYMTARRALKQLLEEGVIRRGSDGKTIVNSERGDSQTTFAFLSPAYSSLLSQQWYITLERILAGHACRLRPVYFVHWDDAAITECLESYDGVFFLPALDPEPSSIMERVLRSPKPVVVLSKDWSGHGIPSIVQRAASDITVMLDHLLSLGHTRIDCFNTQPVGTEVTQSIACWQKWLQTNGKEGNLLNDPVPVYGDSLERAHVYAGRLLDGGVWNSTAVVCLTMSAAMGVMRAMVDRGMRPGRERAVCAMSDVNFCAYLIPSLTSLRDIPLDGFVSQAANWMLEHAAGRAHPWEGSFLLKPPQVQLFLGESTIGSGN